ncbi:hypothetical protein MUK42_32494 [Musa troglodytarum]|uniref:Cysteine proteinase inhibitor n=1 Tax=Musa troglodytarum TaxID=320322 RepID=A0A9E7FQK7_9LILI|nr:hypothetical protein MUK42_32494 [Musa troglodytarum]
MSGINYNLTLQVKDGLSMAKYVAIVYESLKGEKVLESFALIRALTTAHVHDVAVFPVSEHNEEGEGASDRGEISEAGGGRGQLQTAAGGKKRGLPEAHLLPAGCSRTN